MRFFISLLTAAVVGAAIYGVVMERERVQALLPAPLAAALEDLAKQAEEAEPEVAEIPEIIVPKAGSNAMPVVVKVSEAQAIQSGLVLSGHTEADRKLEVRAETSGLVISRPIPKGSSVAEGQLMCQIDLGTRQSSVAQANATLLDAETNFEKTSKLAQRGFTAENAVVSATAKLESARAALAAAETELGRVKIEAPFAGLLESDTAEFGSLLQPGGLCGTLLKLDPIKIVAFVPESSSGLVEIKAEAGARLISGEELRGLVTFVSRSADPVTKTFRVEITAPNPDGRIPDGMSADIVIGTSAKQGHLLPQSALSLNDEGTLGVRLAVDGQAKFAPVEIVRDARDGIWVTGLESRAEVIVVGQEYVRDGRAIEVNYTEAAQ